MKNLLNFDIWKSQINFLTFTIYKCAQNFKKSSKNKNKDSQTSRMQEILCFNTGSLSEKMNKLKNE